MTTHLSHPLAVATVTPAALVRALRRRWARRPRTVAVIWDADAVVHHRGLPVVPPEGAWACALMGRRVAARWGAGTEQRPRFTVVLLTGASVTVTTEEEG